MLQFSLISLSTVIAIIFVSMKHPLAMGLILLVQTVILCLICSLLFQSFWFSYILFLIFLGGMLVLFIYVISLASNEMFSFSMKSVLWSFMVSVFSCLLCFMGLNYFLPWEKNSEMENLNLLDFFFPENNLTLTKLYNFPTSSITLMLVFYLLITLIAAVKITNLFYGPLRKMN